MYERRGGSVFSSFLLGALFGAVLGLLFAPRTGEETREMLTEKANEYWGQAGEMYATGVDRVTDVVASGQNVAGERGEELRARIDEARARLQEQVAKSTDVAKDKVAETAPVVKEVVDKAAAGAKSGVDFAKDKANQGLDFVAKKATAVGAATADAADSAVEEAEKVVEDVPEV